KQLLGEPALADSGLAYEEEEAPAARERVIEAPEQLVQLDVAPDEGPSRCLVHRGGRGRQVEREILLQDRLVKLSQRATGLDPDFADESASCILVSVQCLALPPGAVEREHQLGARPFA